MGDWFLSGLLPAIAGVLIVMNGVGYVRLLFAPSPRGLVFHFTRFIVGLIAVLTFSIAFWDLLPNWFSYNEWRSFIADVGKENVNGIRSVIIIFAGSHGLKALHLMVPEEDRPYWPWWRAWA